MHLTIDGFGGERELLSSETLVRSLLDRYPAEIGMTKISEPHVIRYLGEKAEDWGVSGFVLIAESHIAIHTFPERGYVWVDVFSCKEFETDVAVDSIVDAFGLTHITSHVLPRGLEYPHSVREATPIAVDERLAVAGSLAEAQARA
ncbi:MAG TPA: S-adenosylmethionine decarboxylase [Dehalococcoidia bacterium]